ncbi:MAG TPA: WecB/TagA/CpsF family glycosyltransferase [Terriglobia bacterium]|nr:WecB/TagA/CpsF family glycosyltransferase [Terriglobia bacterium]
MASVLTSPMTLKGEDLPACARVLGVPVHSVDALGTIACMSRWIEERDRTRWIAVTSSHGIVEGFKKADFRNIIESASLSVPDGMWTAQVAGKKLSSLPRRVRGADLLLEFCELAHQKGYSNYFYGDTDEVLGALDSRLRNQFPSLKIAGTFSPPFRALTPEEDAEIVRSINEARPDVLWVGLGLPKQERWIYEHRDRLKVPVIVAVGAAFKFVAGTVKAAPRPVSNLGLEWFWRLLREPKKCWHRALVYGPQFALHSYLELKGFRKYD